METLRQSQELPNRLDAEKKKPIEENETELRLKELKEWIVTHKRVVVPTDELPELIRTQGVKGMLVDISCLQDNSPHNYHISTDDYPDLCKGAPSEHSIGYPYRKFIPSLMECNKFSHVLLFNPEIRTKGNMEILKGCADLSVGQVNREQEGKGGRMHQCALYFIDKELNLCETVLDFDELKSFAEIKPYLRFSYNRNNQESIQKVQEALSHVRRHLAELGLRFDEQLQGALPILAEYYKDKKTKEHRDKKAQEIKEGFDL